MTPPNSGAIVGAPRVANSRWRARWWRPSWISAISERIDPEHEVDHGSGSRGVANLAFQLVPGRDLVVDVEVVGVHGELGCRLQIDRSLFHQEVGSRVDCRETSGQRCAESELDQGVEGKELVLRVIQKVDARAGRYRARNDRGWHLLLPPVLDPDVMSEADRLPGEFRKPLHSPHGTPESLRIGDLHRAVPVPGEHPGHRTCAAAHPCELT